MPFNRSFRGHLGELVRTTFEQVLACCGRLERSRRPAKVVDGTAASAALRALILQVDDVQLQEIAHIWQAQTGQTLARSTVENVAHLHRDPVHDYDIVRRVRPQIPSLSFAHFDDRDLDFANGQ